MSSRSVLIRFPQSLFPELRKNLLEDTSHEAFALLFGKRTTAGGYTIIKVTEVFYPRDEDYESQSIASLRLKREYIYEKLVMIQQQGDIDTIIDVHTHPFCSAEVAFSSVDDHDERRFHQWLTNTLDEINYASIVLSQSDYSARVWERDCKRSIAYPAKIKTQIPSENWSSADDFSSESNNAEITDMQNGFLARGALALGLDLLRQIMTDQTIAIVGVGGLGSVIAENLIHTGFQALHLLDPDQVEITNLNRIVGAYYNDAQNKRNKVDVVKSHLLHINPKAKVLAHSIDIEAPAALPILMQCDWIILATDSHSSRYKTQEIALQLGIPLLSAGVNITVENQQITDMSGEVIVARYGDNLCLNCLGRINPTKIAAERHKGQLIGNELVHKGYVNGQDVKEPAVKTLNAILGAMAVDVLVNQFTLRQDHQPIWVYENNRGFAMYQDDISLLDKTATCFVCS